MTATIIPFPKQHRDEQSEFDRKLAQALARTDARLAADPEYRALLEKARAAIAKLPRRKAR